MRISARRVLLVVSLCMLSVPLMGGGNDCPPPCFTKDADCPLDCTTNPKMGRCAEQDSGALLCVPKDPV